MATVNEPPSSSKIPKHIRKVIFGRKLTTIQYDERFKPAGMEDVITEYPSIPSDQSRHASFDRAMERIAVHGVLRSENAEAIDKFGKPIDSAWFADHLYEDDFHFNTTKATGIEIVSKKTCDMFRISLEKTCEDGSVYKWKSPKISLLKIEGWNYPFQDQAKTDLETLLIEADEFRKGKSSLGQLKMALVA